MVIRCGRSGQNTFLSIVTGSFVKGSESSWNWELRLKTVDHIFVKIIELKMVRTEFLLPYLCEQIFGNSLWLPILFPHIKVAFPSTYLSLRMRPPTISPIFHSRCVCVSVCVCVCMCVCVQTILSRVRGHTHRQIKMAARSSNSLV